MLAGTSVETLAAFAPTFLRHDKLAALGALHDVPVLVVAADEDRRRRSRTPARSPTPCRTPG